MENKERTRTHQDAQELTAQLSKLCTLDTETQFEWLDQVTTGEWAGPLPVPEDPR